MNADKTSIDNEASCAVTEGHTSTTSTMEKVSNPTTQFPTQLNRKNAGCAPAFLFPYQSTNGPFLSSETKTDQNARSSPSPTLEEPNPMNHTAHRFNHVDSCIHKQTKDVATIKGHSSSSISTPTTIVGTELLASQCLQDDELANDAHDIETGRDRNSDRASLLQAGGSCPTFKCLTNCEEKEDILEVEQHVAAAAATSNIPRSLPRGEPEDDNDRTEAGQGSNGAAAAAAAEASKIPRSLQRVDDRTEASQGSNGDVASCLRGGGSCTKLTTTNNMVNDSQNISKPLHAAVGATSLLIGKDVDEKNDENEIAISSTSTDKGIYLLLPEEETDTAAGAAKIVPKASAVNETGVSTKEAAVEEVSTYVIALFFLFSFILTSFTKTIKQKH